MEPSRAEKGVYRLGVLTAVLLSAAMLSQPTIVAAADGDTVTVTIPRDTGLREPSNSGPVVIHGSRAVNAAAAQSPNVNSERNRAASNSGFQQVPRYGSGWDREYNSNGLSYTPWNPGQ